MDRQTINALHEAEAATEKKNMTQQEFDVRAMEIDMELKDLKTEHERQKAEMKAEVLKKRGEMLDDYRERCARRDAEYEGKRRELKEELLELKKELTESSNSNVCGKPCGDRIPVDIELGEDGNPVGVRITTLDESFVIALEPIDDGKEYTWDDAMARLKELGMQGIGKKQMQIIAAYSKEVNEALVGAGGKELEFEWAVGESSGGYAWLYHPTYGALLNLSKCRSSQLRPLLAFEK